MLEGSLKPWNVCCAAAATASDPDGLAPAVADRTWPGWVAGGGGVAVASPLNAAIIAVHEVASGKTRL
jgi:hypothetical protein